MPGLGSVALAEVSSPEEQDRQPDESGGEPGQQGYRQDTPDHKSPPSHRRILFISASSRPRSNRAGRAVGVALVLYVLNAFLPLNDRLAGYAKWSPFYYYLSSDPLNNGMHWGHGALLAGLTAGLVGLSILLFRRRDLREGN